MSTGPQLVLLAAGESARLGEPKALVDLGGASPLERLARAGSRSDAPPPIVVAGADTAAIARALPPEAQLVENPDWRAGRTGSVRAAARARPGADLLVAPVDVPLVPAAVFEALVEEWLARGAPERGWLAPALEIRGGLRPGHPVLIGRDLAAELEQLAPDRPLRELRGRAAPLWTIAVESRAVLDDLDTPDDLKKLRARLAAER